VIRVIHKSKHPNSLTRRKRWNDLNEIIEAHTRSGGAYSYLTWKDVEPVFSKTSRLLHISYITSVTSGIHLEL
jgi:hypothetical protein